MSLHIVMTGYDHTVFEPRAASDTRERLMRYAALLQQKDPQARLTYLALRAPKQAAAFSAEGREFVPTPGSLAMMLYFSGKLSGLKDISHLSPKPLMKMA